MMGLSTMRGSSNQSLPTGSLDSAVAGDKESRTANLRLKIIEHTHAQIGVRRADKIHPVLRLVCPMILLIGVVATGSWKVFVISTFAVLITAAVLEVGRLYWSRFWKVGLTVGLFTVLIRSFFVYGSDVVLQVGPFTATMEGVESALWYTAMLLAVCSPIILVTSTMSLSDLTQALEGLKAPRELTYVVMNSVRMIPELGTRSQAVQDAQRSRGIRVDGSRMTRLKALLPTVGPLVLSSISGVEERAIAMEVRGFGISKHSTALIHERSMQRSDKVIIVVSVLFAVGLAVGVRLT